MNNNTNINLAVDESLIKNNALSFADGLKAGISIAIGYIPIAIAFGILAMSSAVPSYAAVLMSLIVFAGASQFIGIQLIIIGTSPWQIIVTTFILNLRHFLMSSSLSSRLSKNISKPMLSLISFGVTDETFAVATTGEHEELSAQYLIGLNGIAFLSWNFGTWIGIFAGNVLPASLVNSMNIALYCMFIGLLIPSVKNNKPALIVAVSAMLINAALKYLPYTSSLSSGTTIIVSTLLAAVVGTIFFKEVE
jgi:4-azaleucine resistance transporter AzlC